MIYRNWSDDVRGQSRRGSYRTESVRRPDILPGRHVAVRQYHEIRRQDAPARSSDHFALRAGREVRRREWFILQVS